MRAYINHLPYPPALLLNLLPEQPLQLPNLALRLKLNLRRPILLSRMNQYMARVLWSARRDIRRSVDIEALEDRIVEGGIGGGGEEVVDESGRGGGGGGCECALGALGAEGGCGAAEEHFDDVGGAAWWDELDA